MRRLLTFILLFACLPALDAGTLIVLNKSDHNAAFVDPATRQVLGKAPTGRYPHEAAVSPDGSRAYVTNYGTGTEPGNTVTVLDVRKRAALRTFDLGEYKRPHGVAVSGDGKLVWVTCEANQAVLELDAQSGKILQTYRTGQNGSHMVVPGSGEKKLYIPNIASGTLTVIERASGQARSLEIGPGTEAISLTPDGRRLLVGSRGANSVTVLDTATGEIIGKFASGGAVPIRVKVAPNGKTVLVSNSQSNSVAVFELGPGAEAKLLGAIDTGTVPVGILFEPDGKRAYVANTQSNLVSVIDPAARRVVTTITTGTEPDGMAWAK